MNRPLLENRAERQNLITKMFIFIDILVSVNCGHGLMSQIRISIRTGTLFSVAPVP